MKTPLLRQIIKKYTYLNFSELQELLDSSIHECRMAGLFILVQQNVKADTLMRDQIFDFYVKNVRRINNRDLVDLTAPHIL